MKNKVYLVFFIFILTFIVKHIHAQTIWENKNTEAQAYLARMAQKGFIQLHDIIQPIERAKIASAFNQLYQQKEKLSAIEAKELQFYLQEYNQDLAIDSLKKMKLVFLLRMLTIDQECFLFILRILQ